MYLSELQNKDIISVLSGINLGKIVDAKVDNNGNIVNFVAENKKIFRKIMKNTEFSFTFNDITKIGEDCILVNK